MKFLLLALSASLLTVGCSQPKNRLTDDKNTSYQKKLAKENAAKTASAQEKVVLDLKTPEGTVQIPIDTNLNKPTVARTDEDRLPEVTVPKPAVTGAPVVLEKSGAASTASAAAEVTAQPAAQPDTQAASEAATAPAEAVQTPIDTEKSREKAQKDIAAAAGVDQSYKLNFEEVMSLFKQIFLVIPDQASVVNSIRLFNSPESGLDLSKLGLKINGTETGLDLGITSEDKDLVLFKDVKFKFGTPALLNSDGIQLLTACADEKCTIILISFTKVKDGNVLFNLPNFVKIENNTLTAAGLKTDAEYAKEAEEFAKKNPSQAGSQTSAEETKPVPAQEKLNLFELNSVREQITRTGLVKSDDELNRLTTSFISPDLKMDPSKVGVAFGGDAEVLHLIIGYDNQAIAEAGDLKFQFGTAIKRNLENNFVFSGICSNEKCEIIFAAFTKIENDKMVFNLPLILRKSNNQIQMVGLKTPAEYEAEAREFLQSEQKK